MTTIFRSVLFLVLMAACPTRSDAPASRQAWVPVVIDGKISGQAMVQDGTAYLSLRSVAKALRLDVRYDPDNQLIFIRTPVPALPKAKTPPMQ